MEKRKMDELFARLDAIENQYIKESTEAVKRAAEQIGIDRGEAFRLWGMLLIAVGKLHVSAADGLTQQDAVNDSFTAGMNEFRESRTRTAQRN